jgi:hypothetical protein
MFYVRLRSLYRRRLFGCGDADRKSEGSAASNEKALLEWARIEVANVGLSQFARRLQINASNLSKITNGERKLSRRLTAQFDGYLRSFSARLA